MTGPLYSSPQFPPAYGVPFSSFTSHGSVRSPVPHRPYPPNLPPPISRPDDDGHGGSVLDHETRTGSPPPAYSPPLDCGEKEAFLHADLESRFHRPEEEEEDEEVCGKMSNVVIIILIVLNVFVWSMVMWAVICDDEVPRLWEEIQQSDRVVFDV